MQLVAKRYQVLLVDDHPIVLEGLRGLLSRHEDIAVCGEASSIPEALGELERTQADAVIVDISLGRESGLDLIRTIRERYPSIAILALSMLDEIIYAERALRSGANGFIMKQEATHQLVDALRHVLTGRTFVSAAVNDRLLSSLTKSGSSQRSYSIDRLTDRELEIFRLIGMGVGSADIATHLGISQKTVETHRTRIKDKLGIDTAAELVIQASTWMRDGQLAKRT